MPTPNLRNPKLHLKHTSTCIYLCVIHNFINQPVILLHTFLLPLNLSSGEKQGNAYTMWLLLFMCVRALTFLNERALPVLRIHHVVVDTYYQLLPKNQPKHKQPCYHVLMQFHSQENISHIFSEVHNSLFCHAVSVKS